MSLLKEFKPGDRWSNKGLTHSFVKNKLGGRYTRYSKILNKADKGGNVSGGLR